MCHGNVNGTNKCSGVWASGYIMSTAAIRMEAYLITMSASALGMLVDDTDIYCDIYLRTYPESQCDFLFSALLYEFFFICLFYFFYFV